MKRFIFMLCAIFIALTNYSQCDVELSLFDWDSGDIQVITDAGMEKILCIYLILILAFQMA